MDPCRIVILGNAGSGKTTLARHLSQELNAPVLGLDGLAWTEGAERRPDHACERDLRAFIDNHDRWIVEGCYGNLVQAALPHCTQLRFLNPGVEVCLANCRKRPWEPDKFKTPAEQAAMLEPLLDWVRQYETRRDEYGLQRHRAIYDGFAGDKHMSPGSPARSAE